MKSIFTVMAVLFFGATTQAEISRSAYDVRHQTMLEQAIFNACGTGYGHLTQLSTTETEHHVDQGIIDLYFTTELEMTVKIDQGIRDNYKITVQSAKYSAYDHNAKDWGIYAVESVVCELQ